MRDILTKTTRKLSIKLLTVLSVIIIISSFCIMLMSNGGGPAKVSQAAVTGAPFAPDNGNTCASQAGCHNTQVGSFGGSVTTQLLDASNNPVTSYKLGQAYTFKIKFNHTSGSPKYGWQTTVATTPANTDINNWGALPSLTHVTPLSGHNYFEHTFRLATAKDSVRVPWTAPSVSSGSIVFYTAANFVNDNGNATGDQVVTTKLTITDAVLPITLKYFRGTVQNGAAVLSWATATEVNNKNFIIEKSSNGSAFSTLTTIPCKGNSDGSTYTYTDNNFSSTAYYRLKQTDFDGNTTVFNTVQLKAAADVKYSLSAYAHAGTTGLLFNNGSTQTQKIMVRYSDLQGKILYSGSTTANQGNNLITIPSGINKSIIIVTVITEDGTRTSAKIGIQR